MTIVVSDTSPIRALDFLDSLEVLFVLFDRVLIPPAVAAELVRTGGRFRLIDVNDYAFLNIHAAHDQGQVNRLLPCSIAAKRKRLCWLRKLRRKPS